MTYITLETISAIWLYLPVTSDERGNRNPGLPASSPSPHTPRRKRDRSRGVTQSESIVVAQCASSSRPSDEPGGGGLGEEAAPASAHINQTGRKQEMKFREKEMKF